MNKSVMDARLAEYAENHTTQPDGLLAEVAAATRDTMPSPQMMSGVPESRLLEALVVISGARRVLEIGTFTGFGALSMAAVLPKLAPRGVIVADNVLYRGEVLDPGPEDGSARALAAFNDHVQADPRVRNVLLTIGDGYMLAWRDTQSGRSP